MFDYIKPRHKKHIILFQSAGYFLRQCEKRLLMRRLCQKVQTLHCSTAVLFSQGQSFLQTFRLRDSGPGKVHVPRTGELPHDQRLQFGKLLAGEQDRASGQPQP